VSAVVAIIPAAGKGARAGSSLPKQFIEIAGAPILIHTLRKFDECDAIDEICVALPAERVAGFEKEARLHGVAKRLRIVEGGFERSDSILNALEAIASASSKPPELVVVHDAVRPFVTPEEISILVDRARSRGAAILALAATDTIKEAHGATIVRTLDRTRIYRAQTPQAFRFELLREANQRAREQGLPAESFTDDAMLVERLGVDVAIVEGSARNIKITTPDDLIFARRLLEEESLGKTFRTGIGYDIHRLVAGRQLVLGGLEIAFELGLEGHSDGDSLIHAICDALLGAAGLGDIGTHFSSDDERWKGVSSSVFLTDVARQVAKQGFQIENIDTIVYAERPRLAAHAPKMRERLGELLGISESQVNIKAKTNEGLGAVGQGKAIAAQAIVLLGASASGRPRDAKHRV
jgi:2-C-methyl-D-erythritol 4-phosphate cytidylyltransferase/2-C-methyl-D-erythritol 2,4-cyclodiphosphate synthase